jgi:hypothetical protein
MIKKRFDTEGLDAPAELSHPVSVSRPETQKKSKRLLKSNDNYPVSKTIRISDEQAKFLFDETMKASQSAGRVVNEAEIIRSIIDEAMRTGG